MDLARGHVRQVMNRKDILRAFDSAIREWGFTARGKNYSRGWPELTWFVKAELIPRTARVGLQAGIALEVLTGEGSRPSNVMDCQIMLIPTGHPFGLDRRESEDALDEESGFSDEQRLEQLFKIVEAIDRVSREVTTLSELRTMAAEGRIFGRGQVLPAAAALLSV